MTDYTGHIALAYAGMRAAAHFADHWVQTDCQATQKGKEGWLGRLACGRHVSTYVATQAVVTTTLFALANGGTHWWGLVWGLLVSGVTHYWADRRAPLQKLAEKVGKGGFYKRGEMLGSGAYALDQSFHHVWETAAAVLIALN